MRALILLAVFAVLIFASCNTSKNPFFGKRSPHEKYGDAINDAGLKQTQLGILWFDAANKALQQPQPVSLPYKETGYFPAEKPSAAGYVFSAKKGEDVIVNITTVPASGVLFFTELWNISNGKNSLLTTMDTLNNQLKYTVEKDQQFVVRLQPELLRSMEYTLTISTAPSLAFPVDKSGDPNFISFWGAGRDAGARKHEGVDIQAKFRTPVLAATNGITRVSDNDLGGKVVFLRDDNTGYSLYYAHLDSQIAYAGERVKTGDVIGLVGKTGNAIHTVSHLHFGIYTGNGAIDPLAFIDDRINEPKPVTASTKELNKWLRTTAAVNFRKGPSINADVKNKTSAGDAALILAATANWYKVELPDGQVGYIENNLLTNKKQREQKANSGTKIFDTPDTTAPAKTILAKGSTLNVIGSYKDFYLVNADRLQGWVSKE